MNMDVSRPSQLEQGPSETDFDTKLDVTNPGTLEGESTYNPEKRLEASTMTQDNLSESAYNPDKRLLESGAEKPDASDSPQPLTESMRDALVENGMSPDILDKCMEKDGVVLLKTTNNELAGKTHSETGVPFAKKTIDLNGIKVVGVFPKFDALFTAKLPVEKLRCSDKEQFDACNSQLKEKLEVNPNLKNSFTEREQAQIKAGITPSNYTWHHNEKVGKMELVRTDIHAKTGHTGGRAIWGGGTEARSAQTKAV